MSFHWIKNVVRKMGHAVTPVSRVSGYVSSPALLAATTLPALSAIADELVTFGDGSPAPLSGAQIFKHDDGSLLLTTFSLVGSDNCSAVLHLRRVEPYVRPNSRHVQWVRHPVCEITVTGGAKLGATEPTSDPVPVPATERYADTIDIGYDRSLPPLLIRTIEPRDANGDDAAADDSIAVLAVDGLGGAYYEWQAGTLTGCTGVRVHNKMI